MQNYTINSTPLPSTFRGTPQQIFEMMVDRMEVVSDGASFVISDAMPPGNQGPWLKNGTQWWVWDEDSSTYIPLDLTASTHAQIFVGETAPDFTADPQAPLIWLKLDGVTVVGLYYYFGTEVGWVKEASELQPGSITTEMLQDNAVTTPKIVALAVTIEKIADNLPFTKFQRGTALQFLRMNALGTAWETVGITKETPSHAIDTTDLQSFTLAHGWTKAPSSVRVVFRCVNDNHGYTEGQELEVYSLTGNNHTDEAPCSVVTDNVNVKVSFRHAPWVRDPDTGFGKFALGGSDWVCLAYTSVS